jgi:hypothetical protein
MSKCHYSFGRGRRPRGPTYARGTIRSLFENQELARQRMAHDVATRPPCRNLFRDAHFEIIQLFVSSIKSIFSLSVQGLFFVYRFTFSFLSVSLSVSLSVFVSFFRGLHFRGFHFVESWCQPSTSFVNYARTHRHITASTSEFSDR